LTITINPCLVVANDWQISGLNLNIDWPETYWCNFRNWGRGNCPIAPLATRLATKVKEKCLRIRARFFTNFFLRIWCQAKFLTYYCLSAILLLWVKEWSLVFTFLMCLV